MSREQVGDTRISDSLEALRADEWPEGGVEFMFNRMPPPSFGDDHVTAVNLTREVQASESVCAIACVRICVCAHTCLHLWPRSDGGDLPLG